MLSMTVNTDSIINGTAEKRILNGYNDLKANYTKDNALAFSKIYLNESPYDIVKNSRYIFTESYYGNDIYNGIIKSYPELAMFIEYEDEINKVQSYIDKFGNNISVEQKEQLDNTVKNLEDANKENKCIRLMANRTDNCLDDKCKENIKTIICEPENASCDTCNDTLNSLAKSPEAFIFYSPFITKKQPDTLPTVTNIVNDKCCNEWNGIERCESVVDTKFGESEIIDEDVFREYARLIITGNKLATCKPYTEAVNNLPRNIRDFYTTIFETSLSDVVLDHVTKTTADLQRYDTYESAIDNVILEDFLGENILKEEIEKYKESNLMLNRVCYEETFDLLLSEYQMSDDSDVCEGYDFIPDGELFIEAFERFRSDKDSTGKKIEVPKSPDLATKIQNRNMDKEAKNYQKRALREAKGQKIINAAKSVVQAPMNLVKRIESDVRQFDELDDERRKEYMAKPGFRKKWFKNLKLSIMYGAAATTNLALVPVLQACRHFSKKKDIRIRNELVRELDTNISVCEEKINDANAEGDKQEKYRLMRIRDQLTHERNRVRLNSKYI